MKTFADLKRAIVPGTQLTVVAHWVPKFVGSVRTVTKAQGNGYWFTYPGETKLNWGDYPKIAKQLTFPTPDTFRVTVDEKRFWELKITTPTPA